VPISDGLRYVRYRLRTADPARFAKIPTGTTQPATRSAGLGRTLQVGLPWPASRLRITTARRNKARLTRHQVALVLQRDLLEGPTCGEIRDHPFGRIDTKKSAGCDPSRPRLPLMRPQFWGIAPNERSVVPRTPKTVATITTTE
jgi:hypothetical protein